MPKASKAPAIKDRYVRMYGPLLDVLRDLGGEGAAREVARRVADKVVSDPIERNRELASGGNAVENEVAWARNNLREADLIDGSVRGIWKLTKKGWETHLDPQTSRSMGRHADITARKSLSPVLFETSQVSDSEPSLITEDKAAESVLDILMSLPPIGFERLCRRLLTELGFIDVEVTGKTGDGGIDGIGTLKINELVSLPIIFQCKRYKGSVSAEDIRSFRGAMTEVSKDGIFFTTGRFTSAAVDEAKKKKSVRIQLVDGQKLVELMEQHQLGLIPRTIYDVDQSFFDLFRSTN